MYKTVSVLTVSVLTLALAVTSSAQTRPGGETGTQTQRPAWAPPSAAMGTGKLVGMRVRNDQGKELGEIDQLIVDPSEGKITHVVLGRGGLLGVGEQKVALAWSDLKIQPDPNNRTRWVATAPHQDRQRPALRGAPRRRAGRQPHDDAGPPAAAGTQALD